MGQVTDDPVDVAHAVRSGSLAVETPMGAVRFNTGGDSDLHNVGVEINEESKTVLVE